jgi:hypothetical protein
MSIIYLKDGWFQVKNVGNLTGTSAGTFVPVIEYCFTGNDDQKKKGQGKKGSEKTEKKVKQEKEQVKEQAKEVVNRIYLTDDKFSETKQLSQLSQMSALENAVMLEKWSNFFSSSLPRRTDSNTIELLKNLAYVYAIKIPTTSSSWQQEEKDEKDEKEEEEEKINRKNHLRKNVRENWLKTSSR